MSLDYDFIFGQIDKAKKKKKPKHYVPWNSPESKKLQEANTKQQKEQKESGNVSQPKYVKGKETDSRNKPFKGYTKKPAKTSTNQEDIPVTSSTISDIPKPKGAELKRREENTIVDQKRRDDKKRIKDERDRVMRVRSELQERAAKRRDAKEEAKKKKEEKKVRVGGGKKKLRGNLEFEFGQQGGATSDARENQRKERESKTVTETATVAGKKREFKRPKTDNEVVADAITAESNIQHQASQAAQRKRIAAEQERAAKIQAESQGMEGMTDLERQEAQVKQVKTRERKRRAASTHWGIGTKKKPKKTEAEQDQEAKDLKDEIEHYIESEQTKQKEEGDEDTKKSLWKSWLKEKDAVSGKQSKTRKPKGNKATRGGRGISDNTKEGQATDARHLDTPRGSKGTHIRTNMSDVLGDIKDRVSPKLWGYEAHQEKKWKKEGKRGESRAPRPQGHGVSQRGNQSRRDRIVPKKVPEDWKKIDDAVQTDRAKELEERAGKGIPYGKSLWKAWLDANKAEEGIGGMNMGAQRGLGHDAGYKQDSGQSTQITEVKDKEEESKKSAYQTDQQDEGTDVDPNKQQIPPSKPKMDTFKALYKKALITKYNNIYKPANL